LKRAVALAAVAALLVAGPGATAAHAVGLRCSWPMYGRDPGRRFAQSAACTAIDRGSVATLLPTWFTPTADSVTASPAVVGGSVYVGSWDGVMHALDQATGKERWHFAIRDTSNTAFGRIESSAAVIDVARTRVVVFGGGATLYALDARNGHELAAVCVDPRTDPALRCKGHSEGAIEIESSPAAWAVGDHARVVVGMDVHNEPGVGATGVLSYRLSRQGPRWSFEPEWKFDPEAGAKKGCGGVWSSPAVDRDNDLVFFGTSSCSIDGVTTGESMWAIRLSTGALVWKYSPPRQSTRWDDDFGASPNLLPLGLVGEGSKDGTYYALDRRTGKLKWSTQAGEPGHVTTDFAIGGMIGTAAIGTVAGEAAVFATTAISTPLRAPMDETPFDVDPTLADDPGRMFSIHAIRVRDGKILWRSPLSRASYGAASFVDGIVFVPSTFDFSVKALDADTGLPLWESPVVGAPSAAPIPVGDNLIMAAGTRTTDVEYKTFGADPLDMLAGPSPLSPLSGVWGFTLAGR
jgi:polyvinyl alcohol dehydrogenase (cytochrome)